MIITVSSLKGGVGKSTIAQNLAVCFAHQGYKVAIVDADVNQSCLEWSEDRDPTLPYIYVSILPDGRALAKNLVGLNDNYEIILIDGTPSIDPISSRIISVADLLIIPVKAGKMDLRATQRFLDRYYEAVDRKEADIPAYFLFNAVKQGLNITKDTKNVLKDADIKTLKTHLVDRTAFANANGEGKGVFEYRDKKAKKEIVALTKEIMKVIKKL